MQEIKLCKDCKFFVGVHEIAPEPYVCKRPNGQIDRVTGKPEYIRRSPSNERRASDGRGFCGTMGIYFQPKEVHPSIEQKVITFFKNILR